VSGHSKWSSIKHKKAATDAKRGQLFTKLARDITMAGKNGTDPTMNAGLRLAIQKAKDNNMPNDNVDRALQRAAGRDSQSLEEVLYEAYGPGGTAVLIEAVTDNRNRTVADVRTALTRGGGNLAESGAVAWQFELRGVIAVDASRADVDEVQLAAIEAGALDVSEEDGVVEVVTEPGDLEGVRRALTDAGTQVDRAETAQMPKNIVLLDVPTASKTLKLLEVLDDLGDVARVFSNADFPTEALEAAAS
jgi:YebC/PmpR family DNA-binding regulatory protein